MAQPFHQTRLLLRQQLLTALGIASAATLIGCGVEAHTALTDGGSTGTRQDTDASTVDTGGSTGGGTTGAHTGGADASTTASPDAGASDAGPAGDAATVIDASPADARTVDAASADADVMSEPPECTGAWEGEPAEECFDRGAMEQLFRFGTGQIPKEPVPTEAEIQSVFLDNGCLPMEHVADGCCNPAVTVGVPQDDGRCCYYVCAGSCCGRPFVVDGEACLAPVVARADWCGEGVGPSAPPPDLRVAALWLEDARMEHASIAAFARFTQQLLALGAPAELLTDATRAAADEVRHAQICFELAARYGLSQRGPGALPEAASRVSTDLQQVCIETFVEGCIGESVAAHLASVQAALATDPEVREALHGIARDEARHSELAWRFVQWAARQNRAVLPALQAELTGALAQAFAKSVEEESPEALARLHGAGRLSAHEQRVEQYGVLRDVVAPCLAALRVQVADAAVA